MERIVRKKDLLPMRGNERIIKLVKRNPHSHRVDVDLDGPGGNLLDTVAVILEPEYMVDHPGLGPVLDYDKVSKLFADGVGDSGAALKLLKEMLTHTGAETVICTIPWWKPGEDGAKSHWGPIDRCYRVRLIEMDGHRYLLPVERFITHRTY